MGTKYNPRIVTNGLVYYLDAANTRCYSGSGNTWYNLVTGAIGGTMVGVGISSTFNRSFDFNGSAYMTFDTLPPVAQSTYSSTVEVFHIDVVLVHLKLYLAEILVIILKHFILDIDKVQVI